ncbi:RNA polymerase sigma factor [Actinomadura macrotermitis]|uniref:ECF RNA polymerase sigma factor SigE n=1 Tax=Actinomadura macrotermitis TaxID=2585200 RepID=A0A7K0C415_9ACTN|nr:ECF RNA polymerase sigma factor SigE [Actinomadura macrotermitis]
MTAPVAAAPDDAAVIRQSIADPDRFTELYDRHAPAIHRYAARRLGSDAADDLMAETFLIAFRKRRRYDPARADARPWLYGIATRLIARHRRAELDRYRLAERIGGQAAPPVPAPDPHTLHPSLARALAELPKTHRDALLLVAWAELSYEEVAAALDVPVGTVRSRLSRARARLRTELTMEESWTN